MLEEKVREVFADMVVLKDPQRSQYFSNLSIPSYMRDWLGMKFSDDDGSIDYNSVRRYIKRYIPNRDDFEQYKFQMVNGETVQFLARVRVSVDVKRGKTMFELPDFGGSRGGAAALSHSMLRKNGNQRFCTKVKIGALFHFHGRWKEHLRSRRASSRWWATSRFARIPLTWIFTEKRGENLQRRNGLTSSLVLLTIIRMATATKW